MKRNKVFVILIIFVLALVAVALQMLARPGFKYTFAKPTTYAQCVEASGRILESYPTQCVYKGQTFVNPDQHADASPPAQNENQNELKTYEDTTNGFSVQYPDDIFTETESTQKLPYKNKSNPSVLLSHTIPVQHCGLSGLPEHCTDTTTDISISFAMIDAPMDEVVAVTTPTVGEPEDVGFGNIEAKTVTQGAEGEGNVYYFVELPNKKTVMITRSFINEEVVGGYKDKEGFITFAQQDTVFKALMATFKFTK